MEISTKGPSGLPQATEKTPENFPEKNAATSFTIWQARLANHLGISEEELRLRRDKFLTVDVHWQKQGSRNFYSQEAMEKLSATLFVAVAEQDIASGETSDKKATPTAKPAELKVWRTWPVIRNVHVLEAYDPKTNPNLRENILTVRVSSNLNFVRDMLIPVRHLEGNHYELTCRAPRGKGRW